MRTLTDLIHIIAIIAENNPQYALEYQIVLDLQYDWLSLYTTMTVDGEKEYKEEKFSHLAIKTEAQIQEAYWRLYNACGSRSTKK